MYLCIFIFMKQRVQCNILRYFQANVGSVMEQLDTLFFLKEKFETDVMERGLDPTIKMEKAIRGRQNFKV